MKIRKYLATIFIVTLVSTTSVHAGVFSDILHFFGLKTPAEAIADKIGDPIKEALEEGKAQEAERKKNSNDTKKSKKEEELNKLNKDIDKGLQDMFDGMSKGIGAQYAPKVTSDGVDVNDFAEGVIKDKANQALDDLGASLVPGVSAADDAMNLKKALDKLGDTINKKDKKEEAVKESLGEVEDKITGSLGGLASSAARLAGNDKKTTSNSKRANPDSKKTTLNGNIKLYPELSIKSLNGIGVKDAADILVEELRKDKRNATYGQVPVTELSKQVKDELRPYMIKNLSFSEYDDVLDLARKYNIMRVPNIEWVRPKGSEFFECIVEDTKLSKDLIKHYGSNLEGCYILFRKEFNAIEFMCYTSDHKHKEYSQKAIEYIENDLYNTTIEECDKLFKDTLYRQAYQYLSTLVSEGDIVDYKTLELLNNSYPTVEGTENTYLKYKDSGKNFEIVKIGGIKYADFPYADTEVVRLTDKPVTIKYDGTSSSTVGEDNNYVYNTIKKYVDSQYNLRDKALEEFNIYSQEEKKQVLEELKKEESIIRGLEELNVDINTLTLDKLFDISNKIYDDILKKAEKYKGLSKSKMKYEEFEKEINRGFTIKELDDIVNKYRKDTQNVKKQTQETNSSSKDNTSNPFNGVMSEEQSKLFESILGDVVNGATGNNDAQSDEFKKFQDDLMKGKDPYKSAIDMVGSKMGGLFK